MTDNIFQIRQLIGEAKRQNADDGKLEEFCHLQARQLHRVIRLPLEAPEAALASFITQYIEHVPDFLEALTALMKETGIFDQGKVFLTIAEEFFIAPPELISEHTGLIGLLDEAYLSHRMIEEVSDRIQLTCGTALCPMDMNLSNVIVHAILGEEFANQLDLAVHYAIEALFNSSSLTAPQFCTHLSNAHSNDFWQQILAKWPCLAGDSSIELDLEGWLLG